MEQKWTSPYPQLIAELVHGFYRAQTEKQREWRRTFIDDLKQSVPVLSITGGGFTCQVFGRDCAQPENAGEMSDEEMASDRWENEGGR